MTFVPNILFLIGPGGVGKTTSGRILAQKLKYDFVDLDQEFCRQIADVTGFIKDVGYHDYCYRNSELFFKVLEQVSKNTVMVLSSGFLVHEGFDELTVLHRTAIERRGFPLLLLPSESIDESAKIVVERQLKRGFGLTAEKEEEKFRRRYPIFQSLSHRVVYSKDTPDEVALKLFNAYTYGYTN